MSQKTDKEAEWKKILSFQTPKYETSKVMGTDQNFYPVSVGMLFKLKRVGASLVDALALFFANTNNDLKTRENIITDKDGNIQRETTIEQLSFEMAQYRDNQKQIAWKKAFEAIFDEGNKAVIGELIMDCLREVFPRDPLSGVFREGSPQPAEFMNEMPAVMLVDFILGVAKANRDVLGPLGQTVKSHLDLAEKRLKENLAPEVKAADLAPVSS